MPALLGRGQTNLIIIDSVTAVFRGQDGVQSTVSRSQDISAISAMLHNLAEKYKVCVVCVNQVRGLFDVFELMRVEFMSCGLATLLVSVHFSVPI